MWIVQRKEGKFGYIKYLDALNDINRIEIKLDKNKLFYIKKEI